MEEHFRKSLGEDYSKVFKASEKLEKKNDDKMDVDPVKAFKDDLDMTGYTGMLGYYATPLKTYPH